MYQPLILVKNILFMDLSLYDIYNSYDFINLLVLLVIYMVLFCVVWFFLLFCMCFDVPCSLQLYILIEFLKNSHIGNDIVREKQSYYIH